MKRYKFIYYISLLLLIFLVGCTAPKDYDPQIQDLQNQLNEQKNKIEEINNKLDIIEANQFTSEDLRNLFDMKEEEFDPKDYDIQGCPSKRDVINGQINMQMEILAYQN